MTRWKNRWVVAALVIVIALITSGCFQIRFFKVKTKSLAAGETTRISFEWFPVSMSSIDTSNARIFMLIGLDYIELAQFSKFDLQGNWNGPLDRSSNNTLRNLLRMDNVCSRNGIDAADVTGMDTWRAFVSDATIDADDPSAAEVVKALMSNMKLRAPGDAEADDRGNVVIFGGAWQDGLIGAADGVPQAGEVACTGAVLFSIPYTN